MSAADDDSIPLTDDSDGTPSIDDAYFVPATGDDSKGGDSKDDGSKGDDSKGDDSEGDPIPSLTLSDMEARILEIVDASPDGRVLLSQLGPQYSIRFDTKLYLDYNKLPELQGCTKDKLFVKMIPSLEYV